MTDHSSKLAALRSGIDELDAELVSLLSRRAKLTTQVGQIKAETGMPVYVPEREKELIASRRADAEAAGVSPDLTEDLLRRIMRESYHTQNNRYRCINPDIQQVVIVGGAGALGQAPESHSGSPWRTGVVALPRHAWAVSKFGMSAHRSLGWCRARGCTRT